MGGQNGGEAAEGLHFCTTVNDKNEGWTIVPGSLAFGHASSFVEPISKLMLKRKREENVADKEKRGNRPEAQQRCVEDDFLVTTQYAAISASCSQ